MKATHIEDCIGPFSPNDNEDALWNKLHEIAATRYRVTSILYGFAHSAYNSQRIGLTRSLFLKHSHPAEYVNRLGEAAFLNNDICAAAIIGQTEPFLWHTALEWEPATPEQKQQALLDREFGMDVGVSFCLRFADGQGIGGLGFCMRGMRVEEFEKIWIEHGAEMQTLVKEFDALMRPLMVANRLKLTPREREVLAWSAGGLSAAEIAEQIGLATKSVYNILERARKSMQAVTTMEAVAKASVYRLI